MSTESGPVFVEKRAYRRRRLTDAARLLPILGLALMCLPLLWAGNGNGPTSTTYTMIYLFGLWLALVVASALLVRHLRAGDENGAAGEDERPAGGA